MVELKEFTSEKAALRARLAFARKELSDKPERVAAAIERLLPLLHGRVMTYISIGSELDTISLAEKLLLRSDVTVYAPYTENNAITPIKLIAIGRPDGYGNLPRCCYDFSYGSSDVELDFCVTPLLGFNLLGHRIGYGKGCYDRFFRDSGGAYKIGLAFDCQLCEFDADPNDVPLDCCVTEKSVIYF